MFGTLRRIEITEELVEKVAREKFCSLNDFDWDDQNNYVKGMWLNDAADMLNDFNTLVCIFKEINFGCDVDNFGRWHDVEEFYKE